MIEDEKELCFKCRWEKDFKCTNPIVEHSNKNVDGLDLEKCDQYVAIDEDEYFLNNIDEYSETMEF